MKKLIALLLCAMICLSLVACNNTINNGGSTDNSTNDSVLLEKYDAVVKEFNRYVADGYIIAPDWMEGNDATTYLYNEFKALGDYKDCADYLAKFIVVPDALSHITRKETDNFGQTTESIAIFYYYTRHGNCPDLVDLFNLLEFNGDWRANMMDYNYLYDNTNRIIGIEVFSPDSGSTIMKINFEHDTNGNLVKAHFITSENEFINTYTYDDANRLVSADVIYSLTGTGNRVHLWDGYAAQYEYNDAGKLVRETRRYRDRLNPDDFNTGPQYTEYTYNENGYLVQMREGCDDVTTPGEYRWGTTEVYTVNENGKILSAEVTKDDKSYTLVYHYETQYCYTGK